MAEISRRELLGGGLATAALVATKLQTPQSIGGTTNFPKIIFQDNFIGKDLNTALWQPTNNYTQTSTRQIQEYKSYQVGVDNGLNLTARPAIKSDKVPTGISWVSGQANGLVTFLYGHVTVIAKIPAYAGMWPGIMLFADGWPPEIDILEWIYPAFTTAHQTYHWLQTSDNTDQQADHGHAGYNFKDNYHKFELWWGPNMLVWMINGMPTFVQAQSPDVAMRLVINLAVGGPTSWAGGINAQTPKQNTLQVKSVIVTELPVV